MHLTLMQSAKERQTSPASATVFTIGYQAHSVESLIQRLQHCGIQVLMDVRQNPVSRKAGFSRRPLQNAISEAGIEYLHNPDLGTPPMIRSMYRQGVDVFDVLAAYDRHLQANSEPLRRLARIAATKKVCLLCLESDHRMCHRGIIARKLCEMTKWQPIHLM